MNRELITVLCLTMDKQALDKEAINWDEAWNTAVNNWGKFTEKVKEVYREHPEAAGTGTGAGLALLLYGLTTPKGDFNFTGVTGSAGIGGVIGYLLGSSDIPTPDKDNGDSSEGWRPATWVYDRYTDPDSDISDERKFWELVLGISGLAGGLAGTGYYGIRTAKGLLAGLSDETISTIKNAVKEGKAGARKGATTGINKATKAISRMGKLGRLVTGVGATLGIDALAAETGMAFTDPDTGKLTLPTVNTDKWLKRRRGHFENYFDKMRDYGRVSDNKLDLARNLYRNTMGDATLLWDTGKALQGALSHKLKDFMGNKDFDAGTKKLYTKIREHMQKGELNKARQIFEGRHLTTFKDNTFDELVNKYK